MKTASDIINDITVLAFQPEKHSITQLIQPVLSIFDQNNVFFHLGPEQDKDNETSAELLLNGHKFELMSWMNMQGRCIKATSEADSAFYHHNKRSSYFIAQSMYLETLNNLELGAAIRLKYEYRRSTLHVYIAESWFAKVDVINDGFVVTGFKPFKVDTNGKLWDFMDIIKSPQFKGAVKSIINQKHREFEKSIKNLTDTQRDIKNSNHASAEETEL